MDTELNCANAFYKAGSVVGIRAHPWIISISLPLLLQLSGTNRTEQLTMTKVINPGTLSFDRTTS
jgi:hypothetical protein